MGNPKSETEISEIINVFKKYKQLVLNSGKIISRSDKTWTVISEELNGRVSALGLYTAAMKNYFGLHNVLGLEINPLKVSIHETQNFSRNDEALSYSSKSASETEEEVIQDCDEGVTFNFEVSIQNDEFNSDLRPHTELYRSNNNDSKVKFREYTVFQQKDWTNYIYKFIEPILKKRNIKCAIMFKRCKIHPNSDTRLATISAGCKECKSQLFGTIKEWPVAGLDAKIYFTFTGTSESSNTHSKKRPLSSKSSRLLSKYLTLTNIAPSQYRRQRAAEEMNFGDSEPGSLPKLETFRTAKYEEQKKQRIDENVVIAICKFKVHPSTNGCIRDVGIDPFFVHFWSNNQIHLYNSYCKKGYSSLKLDATGSVVKKNYETYRNYV